jgi:hypothetical protein
MLPQLLRKQISSQHSDNGKGFFVVHSNPRTPRAGILESTKMRVCSILDTFVTGMSSSRLLVEARANLLRFAELSQSPGRALWFAFTHLTALHRG